MLKAMHNALHRQSVRIGVAASTAAATMLPFASASSGGSDTSVVSIITSAADSLKSDAMGVIAAGVGIGVVFWGAKVLWSKFKSMAK